MTETPRLETVDAIIPLGGTTVFPITGSFFSLLRAGGEMNVYIGDHTRAGRVGAGFKYRAPNGTQFNQVRIENLGVQAEDVRFAYGVGQFDDQGLLIDRAPNFNTFGLAAPGRSIAALSYQVLWLGGQTDRRAAIISAYSGNSGPVYIGHSNAFVEGIELLPGEKLVLNTTDDIYARNDTAVTQYVNRAELTD